MANFEINTKNGWIGLYRSLLDHPIGNKPYYIAVWIFLLLKANHKPKKILITGKKKQWLVVERGQWYGSQKKIADHYGMARTTVKYIVDFFNVEHMIEHRQIANGTLFTIINYDCYQTVEHLSEQRDYTQTAQTTNKTISNIDSKESILGVETPKAKKAYQSKRNKQIDELLDFLEKAFGYRMEEHKSGNDRKKAWNIIQLTSKFGKNGKVKAGREWLDDKPGNNFKQFYQGYVQIINQKPKLKPQYIETFAKHFRFWIKNQGKYMFEDQSGLTGYEAAKEKLAN